jgi:hypothetical protein
MLYVFAFDRVGVAVGDLFFVDPQPESGQEGAERGVRLEVRLMERPPLTGSIYSSQTIVADRPVWRADLLESVDGPMGSFDRTHHHPQFKGWEPCPRVFEPAMSADPVAFVGEQLADLDALLAGAGLDASAVGPDDAAQLRAAVPEIVAVVQRLLDGVHAGELATAPVVDGRADLGDSVRSSWL